MVHSLAFFDIFINLDTIPNYGASQAIMIFLYMSFVLAVVAFHSVYWQLWDTMSELKYAYLRDSSENTTVRVGYVSYGGMAVE